jgi:hypothetical protein
MLGPDGVDALRDSYAPSLPGDERGYEAFVRDTAVWEYADEHHLRALVLILGVRIVVVPRYSGWAVQVHGDAPPARTIYLGNDDTHYVWLAPSTTPAALDVVDLLGESDAERVGPADAPPPSGPASGQCGMPLNARKKARKKPAAKVKKKPAAEALGRFVKGHTIGKATRFRRKKRVYRGACRVCGLNDATRNSGKDWFCETCQVYTRKRRGRRRAR